MKSKVEQNVSRNKSVPKKEAFDRQDTKPYATV